MINNNEMCNCSEVTTPCRFCFYGACPKCYQEEDLCDKEATNPYCRCDKENS